jgi:tetratricopeptide (TPR) repeat protein
MYRIVGCFFLLWCLSVSTFAYVNAGELLYTPSAIMPKAGNVEYGLRAASYVKDGTTPYLTYRSFFKFSLIDKFEYGMTIGDDFAVRHSLQGKIFTDIGPQIGHHVAIGVKNVGVVTENLLTTEPVFDYYIVYSLDFLENKTSYHIGYSYERSEIRKGLVTGAVEYRYDFGSTIFEWDGRATNFGLKYNSSPDTSMYFLVSPTPVESEDRSPIYFSLGFTFSENIFQKFQKTMVLQEQLDNEMTIVDHRLKAIEARERALADMISVDFLNQLETSFIDRELIQRKMDKETKSLVKGALAHMQKGLEHYYKHEFSSALEEYKIVISLLPTFPMGYVRMGSIYYQLGDNYNAKKHWEKALSLKPKNNSLVEYLDNMVAKASYEDPLEVPIVESIEPVIEPVIDIQNDLELLNEVARDIVEEKNDVGVDNE